MTTLEVPGEISLFRSYNVPPERVTLPLLLRARLGWPLLVLGPAALLILAAALAVVWLLLSGFDAGRALLALGASVVAICLSAAVLTSFADVLRRGPVLILREDGLIDRRASEELVRWSDVADAELLYTRSVVGAVRLGLRRPLTARWNPFRLGVITFRWWRKPCELHVSLIHLSARQHLIAHAIAALVERAGGEVETRPGGRVGRRR